MPQKHLTRRTYSEALCEAIDSSPSSKKRRMSPSQVPQEEERRDHQVADQGNSEDSLPFQVSDEKEETFHSSPKNTSSSRSPAALSIPPATSNTTSSLQMVTKQSQEESKKSSSSLLVVNSIAQQNQEKQTSSVSHHQSSSPSSLVINNSTATHHNPVSPAFSSSTPPAASVSSAPTTTHSNTQSSTSASASNVQLHDATSPNNEPEEVPELDLNDNVAILPTITTISSSSNLISPEEESYVLDEDIYQEMVSQETNTDTGDDVVVYGSVSAQQVVTSSLSADYLQRRPVVTEWMNDVCAQEGIPTCTLFIAVTYLDRYMAKQPTISITRYQLMAAVCIIIACKREERDPPTLAKMIENMGEEESEELKAALLTAETSILNSLRWNLSAITPIHFLAYYISKAPTCVGSESNARDYLTFFIELYLSDKENLVDNFSPSSIACAAIATTRSVFQHPQVWTSELERITGKNYQAIEPCCRYFMAQFLKLATN